MNITEALQGLWVTLGSANLLLPGGLTRDEASLWLEAPMRGAPLYRRWIEPLLGQGLRGVHLHPDETAPLVRELLASRGAFGLEVAKLPPAAPADMQLRFAPAGLPDVDPDAGLFAALHASCRPTDSPRALIQAAVAALRGELGPYPAVGTESRRGLVGHGARIHASVRFRGLSAVGDGCRIGRDVTLGPGAVLGRNCRVAPGAFLADAVLLDGTRVGPGERLVGVVRTPRRDLR